MLHYRLHRDPQSSHQQICRILKQHNPRAILDVGAAQGFMGQLLQGSGLTIDAVEPNLHWAEHARPFYRTVYPSTVEEARLPEATYDAVVCADVLEHLADPVTVLGQLRRVARPGALFVVSVPNIAHVGVRMMLLFGQFPKMERGPLDRTHLQFWTRDTAKQMLRDGGLAVSKVTATGVPLDELWKGGEGGGMFNFAMRSQHLAVALLPRLFGFQWIFQAHPRPQS